MDVCKRRLCAPTVVFALNEQVSSPVSFTPCHTNGRVPEQGATNNPKPLTILVRSRSRPQSTVHRVLVAVKEAQFVNIDATSPPVTRSTYHFSLLWVPSEPPMHYVPSSARMRHPDNGQHQPSARDAYGVQTLVLGASGRGVRIHVGGAIFRCSPSTVVLPFSGVNGAPGGQVSTVDFWPHMRVDNLPESLLSNPSNSTNLIIRFDDGMGRMVVARADGDLEVSSEEIRKTITVIDFV